MTTSVPYYRQYRRDSVSTTQSRASSVEDDCRGVSCHRCCNPCWCCIVYGLCCCFWRPSHQATRSSYDERSELLSAPLQRDRDGRFPGTPGNKKVCCPSAFFSIALFIILASISTLNEDRLTMNIGESRRIHLPFFSQVTATTISNSGADHAAGVRFYAFSTPCPSLTGPVVTLADQLTLSMAKDDYQYDFFYLNSGSMLDVQVAQTKGSTNIYLLQGMHRLKQVEVDDESEDLGLHAILKRFVTSGWDPVRFHYRVRKGDVYTIVYDNASNSPAVFNVSYNATLSTYDVEGIDPTCSSDAMLSCTLHRWGNSCVLVQAVGDSASATNNIVTVQFENHRSWMTMSLLSLSPILLQILYSCFTSKAASPMQTASENTPPDLPPPTTWTTGDTRIYGSTTYAPHHQQQNLLPSAPSEMEEEDPLLSAPVEATAVTTVDPTIPFIPLENIVPIQPPSPNKEIRAP